MKIKFLVLILIAFICFLAYFNSLANPFIWDDEALVVKNTLICSPENLSKSFLSDLYFGVASGSNFWRPLQTISYMFDYHFWQLNPFGYHLTNIILQICVSYLVFLLAFNLLGNLSVSVASAVFFGISPIHTEAVTYISGRAEMLMGFFIILATLFFIKAQEKTSRQNKLFFIFSVISFLLALLSKEAAVVFPFIICGYLFYFLNDRLKEKYYFIKNIAVFFLISLVYLSLRLSLFKFLTLRPPALTGIPWFIRLSVLPKIIFTYFRLLLWPVGLHMSRELACPVSPFGIFIAVFFLGLVIFSCACFLKYRPKHKVISFMLLWSLAFFIPQSGILPINAFVAEHFIYLSSISFFMLLAFILHKFFRKESFVFISCLICVFYILLTCARNFEWRNPVIFFKNIIKHSANSFQAHNNLGLQYEYLNRLAEAEKEYKKALVIKPDLIEARSNLANLYLKLKNYDQAKNQYELLLKDKVGSKAAEIENNLGNVYEAVGEIDNAVIKYNQALTLDAGLKFTHFNLARIYFARKNLDQAVFHISQSLGKVDAAKDKIIADFLNNTGYIDNASEFYNNLGINFANNNCWKEAISAFNCALELSPDSADYYYNLGLAYLNIKEKNKATQSIKQALRINPNHIRAKGLVALIK